MLPHSIGGGMYKQQNPTGVNAKTRTTAGKFDSSQRLQCLQVELIWYLGVAWESS